MQGQLQPGVKFRLAGTCMPVYDMWRNVSSGFDIGPTYRPIWSCRYRLSCSDSYQTDTDISVLLHIKPIRIIGLNRLFTGIILYLDYPNLIREVLQLLRKSITVVVRFLITLTSMNFYFLVIALSISGTGSILNLSTVNIHCNFLVLRQPTPARNICIDDIVESCKVNCNFGSTSDWWILTFSAHCRL